VDRTLISQRLQQWKRLHLAAWEYHTLSNSGEKTRTSLAGRISLFSQYALEMTLIFIESCNRLDKKRSGFNYE